MCDFAGSNVVRYIQVMLMTAQKLYRFYALMALLLGLLFMPFWFQSQPGVASEGFVFFKTLAVYAIFPVLVILFLFIAIWSVRLFTTRSDTVRVRIASWMSLLLLYPLTEIFFQFGQTFWMPVIPVILIVLLILPLNWWELPQRKHEADIRK